MQFIHSQLCCLQSESKIPNAELSHKTCEVRNGYNIEGVN